MSSAPAAAHALTSDVACASEVVPPGGIEPPNHESTELDEFASVAMQFGEPQSLDVPLRYVYIALALFISL